MSTRIIKFRAWDKYLKEMTNVYFLRWGVNGGMSNTNFIYMQYTGLKDKNGKEIYEGDIVVTHGWQGAIEMSHTGAYVIAQGSFKELLHDYVYNKWDIEVIGNIYENPELLND